MKTPEQIAVDVLDAHAIQPHWVRNREQIAQLIAEAVEADRAQPAAEIHPDYRDDQENVRDAARVEVAWRAYDAAGRLFFESDMMLTAAEAVGMFQGIGEATNENASARIAELTAIWEEATGDRAADYVLSGDDWSIGLDEDEAAEIVRLIEWMEGRA